MSTLQDLTKFTVTIYNAYDEGRVVGTGILIDRRLVVTCKHVVKAAITEETLRRNPLLDFLGWIKRGFRRHLEPPIPLDFAIDLPIAKNGPIDANKRRVRLLHAFADREDDVVVLEILGGDVLVPPEDMPRLGRAGNDSNDNNFKSYGFHGDSGERPSAYNHAKGNILGPVPPRKRTVMFHLVQLRSPEIDQGMSGAAVLDVERNLVVGIVCAIWRSNSARNEHTAWAVDARALDHPPMNIGVP